MHIVVEIPRVKILQPKKDGKGKNVCNYKVEKSEFGVCVIPIYEAWCQDSGKNNMLHLFYMVQNAVGRRKHGIHLLFLISMKCILFLKSTSGCRDGSEVDAHTLKIPDDKQQNKECNLQELYRAKQGIINCGNFAFQRRAGS